MNEKICFRCGKAYLGNDRILCNDCLKEVKDREEDREHFLWYHTLKKYRERFGKDTRCSICGKTISILSSIVRIGVGIPVYYHPECYNMLEFNDSPETISYILIEGNSRKETFEII
jgi:hypothetical protein